jgi:hypothetical protein
MPLNAVVRIHYHSRHFTVFLGHPLSSACPSAADAKYPLLGVTVLHAQFPPTNTYSSYVLKLLTYFFFFSFLPFMLYRLV